MKTCRLDDFMQELKPWLSSEYIREVYLDNNDNFVLLFLDGMQRVYHIEDCSAAQAEKIFNDLKKKGVTIRAPASGKAFSGKPKA